MLQIRAIRAIRTIRTIRTILFVLLVLVIQNLNQGLNLNAQQITGGGGSGGGGGGGSTPYLFSTYGVRGNGTTNDSTAIQAAITAACTAGGGIVQSLANGSYNIGSTGLVIPCSNVSMVSGGGVQPILYTGSGAALTVGVSTSGVFKRWNKVSGFQFDLSGATNTATGIILLQTWNTILDSLWLTNTTGAANPHMNCIQLDGGRDDLLSTFGTFPILTNVNCNGDWMNGIWVVPTNGGALADNNAYTAISIIGGSYTMTAVSVTGATSFNITSLSATTPVIATVATSNSVPDNTVIKIVGSSGCNPTCNGVWYGKKVDATHIRLLDSASSGAGTGGTYSQVSTGITLAQHSEITLANADVENFGLGLAINSQARGQIGIRFEGNTLDWQTTSNSLGTNLFASSWLTKVDNGSFTSYANVNGTGVQNLTVVKQVEVTSDVVGNPATLCFGPFQSACDTTILRLGATTLGMSGEMLWTQGFGQPAMAAQISADTTPRIQVTGGGTVYWSAGSGSVDTNLYRNGTGLLKTDQTMQFGVGTQLVETTVAGLGTCDGIKVGTTKAVSDAAAAPVYNATVAGGGSVHLVAYCNGTNWTNH